MMRFILIFGVILNCLTFIYGSGLIEVFKWKQIDYANPGIIQKSVAGNVKNSTADAIFFPGQFIQYNNVPMGVTHYKGRLFITMPRRREGIPSTLNYIDLKAVGSDMSPKLTSYPSFEMNQFDGQHRDNFKPLPAARASQMPNTKGFVSVYRTTADSCGRLWFADTGMLEYPNNRMQIQKPSIWIMDLKTDSVLHRFEFPDNIAQEGRGCASITIDTDKGCDNTYAYIPDLVNSQLYVYSLQQNRIWAFKHNNFNFDPAALPLNIAGQTFSWMDGIFSTTMGPKEPDGSRNVFFHPMASTHEFFVLNSYLQNEANTLKPLDAADFRLLGNRGTQRQSTMHEFDQMTGVLFYAEVQRYGVGCWNAKKLFSTANHGTVDTDEKRMIYPSDLTIDDEGNLWVFTNTMPVFALSTLDKNTYNFRVWKQSVSAAIADTVCDYKFGK